MEFTGERVVPGQTDIDLMNEHLARYAFAERLAGSKRVLDIGCGVPYGSALLARNAREVLAIDRAPEPLREGRKRYGTNSSLRLVTAEAAHLPLTSASVDLVVAFEVIEHLENWKGLLSEASRVLRPAGQLIVSTPNRLYYSESRETPNPFHVHEFEYEEFEAELRKIFAHTSIFLQNHADAITFSSRDDRRMETMIEPGKHSPDEAHFFVAVCSRQSLGETTSFVYVPHAGNVLREREKHIDLLEAELREKSRWLQETSDELEKLTKINKAEQEKAQEAIEQLEAENKRKTEWAQQLEERLEERSRWAIELDAENKENLENYHRLEGEWEKTQAELKKCIELLDAAEKTVIERTEWAQGLGRELETLQAKLAALYASPAYRLARAFRMVPHKQ